MQVVALLPTEYREVTAEQAEEHSLQALQRRLRQATEAAYGWRRLSTWAWYGLLFTDVLTLYLWWGPCRG